MPAASASSARRSGEEQSLLFARAALAIATLLWAGNFIAGRALRHEMAPLELNFWRWLVALAALLPFTASSLWRGRRFLMRNGGFIGLLALTGVVVPHTCVYAALGAASAVNALLLMSVAPLLIHVGDWAIFGAPMHKRQWLGMTVALTGAAILIARGDVSTLVSLRFGKGDLWMIPAVFSVATQALLLKCSPDSIGQAPLLAASVIAALVMMLPMMLMSGSPIVPPSGTRLVAGLLYVGVLASAAAFLLWNRGVARLGPGRSGPFLYLMPVYGSILSGVLLGEAARNFQYVGGALVFLGLWLAGRRGG